MESVEFQKPMLENIDDDPVYSYHEQRKIIRRIDVRLVVMLGFLHTVALIDRGNLGTASVAGMQKELHLHGTQYVSSVGGFKGKIVTDNMLEHNCSSVLPPLHLPPDIWPHSGA